MFKDWIEDVGYAPEKGLEVCWKEVKGTSGLKTFKGWMEYIGCALNQKRRRSSSTLLWQRLYG